MNYQEAIQLYPDYWEQEQESGSFYGPCNYGPILKLFGEIKIRVDDNNYQGDTRVLYYRGDIDRWGYLIFGWGSCSGCDALQGCTTMAEIQELIDNLRDKIKWFDSLGELNLYFRQVGWELKYEWHQEETREFIDLVLKFSNQEK